MHEITNASCTRQGSQASVNTDIYTLHVIKPSYTDRTIPNAPAITTCATFPTNTITLTATITSSNTNPSLQHTTMDLDERALQSLALRDLHHAAELQRRAGAGALPEVPGVRIDPVCDGKGGVGGAAGE
ncbi:hypothetical protein IFR05_016981, partial [Cadophora sp. M221]